MAVIPRYRQVKERLWKDMTDGAFPGQLPPEPDLAKHYEVARSTLRRAMAELRAEGFLVSRQRRGTFVSGGHAPAPTRLGVIGMVLEPRVFESAGDPYFGGIASSIAAALLERGHLLVIAKQIEELVASSPTAPQGGLPQRRVDGIIAAAFDQNTVWNVAAARIPLVLVDSAPLPDRTCVLPDNRSGMDALMRHLVELGHRRIAHVAGAPATVAAQERLMAYREACARHHLAREEGLIIQGHFNHVDGIVAADALMALPTRPTAIACANDRMALGVLQRLRELGIRVPQDVAVAGFDDIDAASHSYPDLTTVHVDRTALARAAAGLLLDEIERRRSPGGAADRIAVRLVIRSSTRPESL